MLLRSVTIVEEDKNQIRQYLLGQSAEADEERVELRLMSDPAFSEEFDIVVDEIATLYVSGQLKGDEKTQVEQYFLRSPERRRKVQFICELFRQMGEERGEKQAEPVPVELTDNLTDQKPAPEPTARPGDRKTLWQRIRYFWRGQHSALRPAISFAIVLLVGGLVYSVILLTSKPTYMPLELSMTNAQRDTGTEIKRVRLESGVDGLRIKLRLPTPTAPQYRASLRGERVSLPQLAIEAQDPESITVLVPADEISRGTYAIELTENHNGSEKPLRGAYVFAID